MPTLLKGWCLHCRGRIEVPVEDRRAVVECPGCGRDVAVAAAVEYRRRFRRIRRTLWMGVLALIAVGCAAAIYRYRSPLQTGFDLLVQETGSNTLAALSVIATLFVLLTIALWMVFPIVVYLGLMSLGRRAAELDETTKLCAGHLARLTRLRELPQHEPPHELPSPGPQGNKRPEDSGSPGLR